LGCYIYLKSLRNRNESAYAVHVRFYNLSHLLHRSQGWFLLTTLSSSTFTLGQFRLFPVAVHVTPAFRCPLGCLVHRSPSCLFQVRVSPTQRREGGALQARTAWPWRVARFKSRSGHSSPRLQKSDWMVIRFPAIRGAYCCPYLCLSYWILTPFVGTPYLVSRFSP
jgi:hypothetical protein